MTQPAELDGRREQREVSVAAHRTSVAARLLARGLTPETLELLLPGWHAPTDAGAGPAATSGVS